MQRKQASKTLSLLLAICLILVMPITAAAEGETSLGDSSNATPVDIVITSFDELTEETLWQGYDFGEITTEDEINLPDTLSGTDDENNPVTLSGVTWQSSPDFDWETSQKYEFSPSLPQGYTLGLVVNAPVISVFIRPEGGVQIMSMAANASNQYASDKAALIYALKKETPNTIILTANIALDDETVYMGESHTIDTGSFTLTIKDGKDSDSGGRIHLGEYTLTLKGKAVIDSVQGICSDSGTLNLEDVTATLNIANSIMTRTVNVNNGATVNLDSSRSGWLSEGLLSVPESDCSLNVNSGGTVNIQNAVGTGIRNNNGGTITINSGGAISIGAIGSDNWGIFQQNGGALKLNGGELNGTEGGAVFINTGTTVEGMSGKFIDRGITLTATGEVTVGDETAQPSATGLSSGLYVWNGSAFAKAGSGIGADLVVQGGNGGNGTAGGDGIAGANDIQTLSDTSFDNISVISGNGGDSGGGNLGGVGGNAKLKLTAPVVTVGGTVLVKTGSDGDSNTGAWCGEPHFTVENTLRASSITVESTQNNAVYWVYVHTLDVSEDTTLTISGLDAAGNCVFETVNIADGKTLTINNANGDLWMGAIHFTGSGTGRIVIEDASRLIMNELNFFHNPAFDISASAMGTAITSIDVSKGVVGGAMDTTPYTFSAAGLPAGISINPTTGVISGTPTAACAAGTATITVTDSYQTTKSITIHYGAVSADSGAGTNTVTVVSGTGGGDYAQGATVTITADVAPSGQRFKEWNISPSVTFAGGTSKSSQIAIFTMPVQAVTATATYENIPADTTPVTSVALNRTSLSLYSNTTPNTATLIATVSPSGATDKTVIWASGNTAVATVDQNGNVTAVGNGTAIITVTTIDGSYTDSCTVTVSTYSSSGGSTGGGNGGSSGSGNTPSSSKNITTDKKTDQPVIASQDMKGTADKNGKVTLTITESQIKSLIDKAKATGNTKDGIGVTVNVQFDAEGKDVAVTLDEKALALLISSGVEHFEVSTPLAGFTFDKAAIKEISNQTTGAITISVVPITKLSFAANALIGSRPVYDLTVSYQKDGKTVNITSFGKGWVSLAIDYQAAYGEKIGNLFGVYVDGDGKPQLLQSSSYNNGKVIFSRNTLSTYGVGYKAWDDFTDITNHWAKDNIDFVVSRGLLTGTTATTFAPNTEITRADFLMALGKLSSADVSSYTKSSFTDVTNASAAMPYIEWAVKNKIVQGIGDNKFGPDNKISRQDMAVMMVNYAKATGYTLPVSRQAVTFTDNDKISTYAKDAVKAIQQADIIVGKDTGKFDPQANATRAEASTILRQFVESVIDEGTARGWVKNDSGQWMHYNWEGERTTGWLSTTEGNKYYFDENGLMVSGKWVQIGGKWYYFHSDGKLAVNTTIDGYEVDADGARKK